MTFGPFVLDREGGVLEHRGREVELPERSFRLLLALVDAAGSTVTKDRLVDAAWRGASVSDTSITEAMSRLRDALGDDARSPTYVKTVHGRGYRFIAPIDRPGERARGPARWPRPRVLERRWLPWSIAATIAVLGAISMGLVRSPPTPRSLSEAAAPRFRLAEYALEGGKVRDFEVPALPFNDLAVNRAGDRVAFSIAVGGQTGTWIMEPGRGELRRLTEGGSFTDPVWSSDGASLALAQRRGDSLDLVSKKVDEREPARLLLAAPFDQHPEAWLGDGGALVYSERHPETGFDLWILRRGPSGVWHPAPLVRTAGDEAFAAISPDDRYMAFTSKNGPRPEIYVTELDGDRPPFRVSPAGGAFPFWSRDGESLHYVLKDRVLTLAADQIGRIPVRGAAKSTEVPGLRLAVASSSASRIVVAMLDTPGR